MALLSLLLAVLQEPVWPPAPPLEQPAAAALPADLPPSIRAESRPDGLLRVEFAFDPPAGAEGVFLAGSFNGWNPTATPMSRGGDGVFRVTVPLQPGRWLYKFVVDGRDWYPDPRNPEREDDGHSGFNSVLALGRLARLEDSDGVVGDGRIEAAALGHDPTRPRDLQRLPGGRVLLRYRTLAHDVAGVEAVFRDGPSAAMAPVFEDRRATLWEAVLPAAAPSEYTFVLSDGDTRVSDPATYRLEPAAGPVFRTPDWAKDAVWYQVLVDRFRNGDPAHDPPGAPPWTGDWFELTPAERAGGQTFYRWAVFQRRYGGDLAGLAEKLDYLEELGVNALYLNPIFQAPSHHKYDATDYRHVDDFYGGGDDYAEVAAREDLLDPSTWEWTTADRAFLAFLRRAHERGFKVILDGVFNHVGEQHPAFRDVRAKGKDSRFADWFAVESWEPFRYRGWGGFGQLPEFAKSPDGLASPSLKAHIFAVTRRWMDPDGDGDPSDGIDGWRLDVPNEVPGPFWEEWRRLVKSINPDAYLTGEVWDDASAWLDGRRFDAVMNYPFARAAIAWIGHRERKIPASECAARLAALRLSYPAEATYVLQNLLDSHDTDRVASMMRNPDRDYDRLNRCQDDNPRYDNSKPRPEDYQRVRLLALLQMTSVGAPMIYYGDEVGMWGADDPNCRKPMLWADLEPYARPRENRVEREHLAFYRRAIALRRGWAALRRGEFRTVRTDDAQDLWLFLRRLGGEEVLVALCAGDRPARLRLAGRDLAALGLDTAGWRTELELPGLDGAGGSWAARDGDLILDVPPIGGLVLARRRGE
ncbi:MAG: hypothetical protein D6702_01820 [Planctomycetota bacterium]|nr:MAG: hypothetical protein D6702_01820 [Planctomycetota bacterium]